ncbi:MAG: NAD(P)-dependent oxidoreductase [Paenibacillaceae bacterium]
MNILVTGATGRVGSRLVPRLLQRGDSVRILVRDPDRAQTLKEQGAEIIVGDLLNAEALTRGVANMDAVIHLAAFFRGATPEESQTINLEGSIALARASIDAGVPRFIFTSTNLVYGPGKGELFKEDDPFHSTAPYPKSKVAAEQALMELHRVHGLGLRIVRLAFVYGEGDPHLNEGLQWFRNWNPKQQIHMVHHADVAQAIMLATDKMGIDGNIYNVADNEPIEAAEIMKLFGESIADDAASRALDPAWQQYVDVTKIRRELGFQAIYPTLRDADTARAL